MDLNQLIDLEKVKLKIDANLVHKGSMNIGNVRCHVCIYEDDAKEKYSMIALYFSVAKGWDIYTTKKDISLKEIFKTIGK